MTAGALIITAAGGANMDEEERAAIFADGFVNGYLMCADYVERIGDAKFEGDGERGLEFFYYQIADNLRRLGDGVIKSFRKAKGLNHADHIH